MNEVFIIGKIKSKIEFKFIINSKKYFSKAKFKIETLDNQEITIIGHNNMADYALKYLKRNDKVFINGRLNTDMEIEAKEIKMFQIIDIHTLQL